MIEVVERKGVPVYETECYECNSKLRYTRADMHTLAFIECPVCGVSIHVIPTEGSHVALIVSNGELPKGCASCENKCRLYQRAMAEVSYLQENRLIGCPLEGEE